MLSGGDIKPNSEITPSLLGSILSQMYVLLTSVSLVIASGYVGYLMQVVTRRSSIRSIFLLSEFGFKTASLTSFFGFVIRGIYKIPIV